MADELSWLHFYDHTGGLNTRYSGTTTPIFDATEALNVETVVRGGFRKMDGYARLVEAPIIASGTEANGEVDLDDESDAWTGAGDASSFSTSGGIGSFDESSASTAHQRYTNTEAGFTTGTDAAYETRLKIDDGGTLSGVYAHSICVLDDSTDRFELVAVEVSGTKQLGVLTTTGDRTVSGSYSNLTDFDWSDAMHRYRVLFDASGNVDVYVDDMTTALITIAVSSLPASTETTLVGIGSYETATEITWDFDYIRYKIGALALDTEPITGLYDFRDETGTNEMLCTAGTAWYTLDTSVSNWSALSGGTAITDGAIPHFVTWTDPGNSNVAIVIMVTESQDTPQKYDGTTRADLGGSPPSGKFVEIYHERCFIANTSANPAGLFYSAFGDPEDRDDGSGTWDTTNDLFQLDRHIHGEITGLAEVNDKLLIFQEHAVWRLQGWGPGSFLLEQITSNRGNHAPSALLKGPYGNETVEGVYFRDRDGYWWTNGEIGQVIKVSQKIQTTIDEDFNLSQVGLEVGFVDTLRDYVGFSVPLGADTTNSRIYMLDYIAGGRRQEDGFFSEGWHPCSFPMRAAANRLVSGKDVTIFSDHNGLAHTMFSGTTLDNDADYQAYRTSAWLDGGAKHLTKIWRYLVLFTQATGDHDLIIKWGINYQDDFTNEARVNLASAAALLGSTFVLGTSKLGTTGLIHVRVPIDVTGSALRLRFETESEAEPFTMLGFSVGFEALDWFESNVIPVVS